MRFQNFRWGRLASRSGLYSVPPVLLFTSGAVVLPLLMFLDPVVCYQIPRSFSLTLTGPAPPPPPSRIATTSLNLKDRIVDLRATKTHRVYAKDEHTNKDDDTSGQATAWTSTQRIPLDWAGAHTFETVTRITSEPRNTISPRDPPQNGDSQSGVISSASIFTDPPIHSQIGDLKRSAGIFAIIRAIVISWTILLVGILTYLLARFVDILTQVPAIEAESDEDNERTALLGQSTV